MYDRYDFENWKYPSWKIIFSFKERSRSISRWFFFFFFHGWKDVTWNDKCSRELSQATWFLCGKASAIQARERMTSVVNSQTRILDTFFIPEETTKTTDKDPFSSSFYEQINFSLWIELDPVPIRYINPWYSALT